MCVAGPGMVQSCTQNSNRHKQIHMHALPGLACSQGSKLWKHRLGLSMDMLEGQLNSANLEACPNACQTKPG